MSGNFTESVVEDAALIWLESLSYAVLHGSEVVPNETARQTIVLRFRPVVRHCYRSCCRARSG